METYPNGKTNKAKENKTILQILRSNKYDPNAIPKRRDRIINQTDQAELQAQKTRALFTYTGKKTGQSQNTSEKQAFRQHIRQDITLETCSGSTTTNPTNTTIVVYISLNVPIAEDNMSDRQTGRLNPDSKYTKYILPDGSCE
jgi:flagellar motor protein MotB